MKIRSITFFCNPGWPLQEAELYRAADFLADGQAAFEDAGYPVQTTRLSIPPFARMLEDERGIEALELALQLENHPALDRIGYISLGPAEPLHPWSYTAIPEIIAATERIFTSAMLTESEGVSLFAVRACARIIHRLGGLSSDGITNLRFGALANVLPGGPFFPGSYHSGGAPVFALATEAADLAVNAFQKPNSLEHARQDLIRAVENHARMLEVVAVDLTQRYDVQFGGFDFTLAPFPLLEQSFGHAMELLGVPQVGLHGSLAAAGILADTLEMADYPRAGYNGLFLPVLEDAILAERAALGVLTVKDLLLYSAVCGTGLDTVPLPGDTTTAQLEAILLDVAVLSQRLMKPLTARLMPVPGKRAGDETGFSFPYFAKSRILAVDAQEIGRFLTGEETVRLSPRASKSHFAG